MPLVKCKMRPCRKCHGTGKEPDPADTGRQMRKLRERRDVSLRKAAAAMALSPTYLSHLEHGKRDWSDKLIKRYWKAITR